MRLASARIITADIKPMVDFYRTAADMDLIQYTEDFAELRTETAVLAIGSIRTLQLFGGGHIATPGTNRAVIIEFQVDDVDAHYNRLAGFLGEQVVQVPTTMPWGNRSLLFRDPDGNLVNFFTPLTGKQ
ncbi:VOC family protein [Dyadobacter sandarakinus]|uniref:VOC family protein n=1 Tax=Dyadobacter sandarakinus TaxID=2747268 RepID=A0ABX7I8U7_9BACT|nr:VOC family protein [Dyadobacter sandarakinus]QRR01401.1 VOC family protein [Dyadobacter sandarakinus]